MTNLEIETTLKLAKLDRFFCSLDVSMTIVWINYNFVSIEKLISSKKNAFIAKIAINANETN